MKTNLKYIALGALVCLIVVASCKHEDIVGSTVPVYKQEDMIGRPAINTVFNNADKKDAFNVSEPSTQADTYDTLFKAKLLALNPAYDSNILMLDTSAFIGVLSTDVLNVSLSGTTTFFDGTNVLTGRALADDVIDTELTLIFGGKTGGSNPGLTSDHVSTNDVPFLTTFPYLAAAH